MKLLGAAILLAGTLVLMLLGDPDLDQVMRWQEDEARARLESGEVHVEPAELLALLHDRSVRLRIADLRDEAQWNSMHLVDSERVTDPATWGADLDFDEIVILVDQDGARSAEVWRVLHARKIENCYLLAGGMEAWNSLFGPDAPPAAALGDRHPAALPEARADLGYEARVRRIGKAPVLSGGCG